MVQQMNFISKITSFCTSIPEKELELIAENHDLYLSKAAKLIMPYIEYSDKPFRPKKKHESKLFFGIRYLDAVTTINPKNHAAYWVKGKAYQAMRKHSEAYKQFQKAFDLYQEESAYPNELAKECLTLGKFKEAIIALKFAFSLEPEDAGLLGNLALSYLLDGETLLAKDTIQKAQDLNSDDIININIYNLITDVLAGKRERPKTLLEASEK
jgi:tetratricopeptide (TPR) repeat protein